MDGEIAAARLVEIVLGDEKITEDSQLFPVSSSMPQPASPVLDSAPAVEGQFEPKAAREPEATLPEVERDPGHFPTPPLYFGAVRLHDWKTTAKGGMSVDVGVLDAPPTGLHPFKGLYCGKQSGQRLRIWFGQVGDEVEQIDGLHAGEGLLLRWSDDSVNGMSVKILLDDGPDGVAIHPFTGLPTGRAEGEKLQMAAWAISDNERLLDPRQTRKRVPFYELSEVRQAHILCGDAKFVSYLKRHEPRLSRGKTLAYDVHENPRGYATEVVYAYLKTDSRKTLNQDNAEGRAAQKLWSSLVREFYDDFYNRR
jgi:hypothetical protein